MKWFKRLIKKFGWRKHRGWEGIFEFEHRDRNGNVIWRHVTRNALADQGEQNMLDDYLRNQNAPSSFYLALFNDTPTDTDTLADLTGEPSGNGYQRQQIERNTTGWPTLELHEGDYRATSKLVTFVAEGGSWGPVTHMILTNVASGTQGLLIAYAALSKSRTLDDGETLGCRIRIKLK